jgi:hypothetical protein
MYMILLMLANGGCSDYNHPPGEVWKVLVAKEEGFKVEYPKRWRLYENEMDTRFLLLAPEEQAGFSNNFSMMERDVRDVGIKTLEEFDELSERQIKSIYGRDIKLRMHRGILQGYHCSEYRFSAHFRGLDMKWRQWVILKGRTAYIFTYAASEDTFKQDLDTIKEMLESFQFTGRPG